MRNQDPSRHRVGSGWYPNCRTVRLLAAVGGAVMGRSRLLVPLCLLCPGILRILRSLVPRLLLSAAVMPQVPYSYVWFICLLFGIILIICQSSNAWRRHDVEGDIVEGASDGEPVLG